MQKRFLSLCIAAAALFASCTLSKNDNPDGSPQNPTGENGEAEVADGKASIIGERLKIADGIGDEDMGGMKVRILTRDLDDMSIEFIVEEETGDNVDDAIYLRNKKIEDRFNISFVPLSASNASQTALKAISAGDDAYDLIGDNMVFLASSAMKKPYIELNSIETMDTSQRWFLQDAVKELSINGKLYILPGEACTSIMSCAYCYFFNKKLVADYKLEDPYRLVIEGKWTLDKFYDMIKGLYKDIDGDGAQSVKDFYGFSSFNVSHPVAYTYSSGLRITRNNADGIPEFAVPNEKTYSNFEKVFRLLCDNPDTYGAPLEEQDLQFELFTNKQAVFFSNAIGAAVSLRDFEDDFGIVPLPKYDEAQERYYTFSDGHASMLAVPTTVQSPERVGKILTAMNAESWKTVVPQIYDVALKVKFLRDDESVQTLDMLLDGRTFDLGYIYDDWKGYGFYMWDLIVAKNSNVASYFEKKKNSAEKNLERVIRTFDD